MIDINHLHPMIVHFPIALLMVGFLSDLLGITLKKDFFNRAGYYLLILGTIGVVAAYFSGEFAGDGVVEAGALGQALETHESAALISLWLMVGTALVRIGAVIFHRYNGIIRIIAILLFFVGILSIARTGYYGGELVYKHAAGVQLNLGIDFNNADIQKNSIDTDDD